MQRRGRALPKRLQPPRAHPDVAFTPPLSSRARDFADAYQPLAGRDLIEPAELRPYPRYHFEHDTESSLYCSGNLHGRMPHLRRLRYSCRNALASLLESYGSHAPSDGCAAMG